MKIKQLMWVGSAALGMLAVLALRFTVSSAPLPPTHPAVINARISDAWAMLNHKGDRLPLPPVREWLPLPATPAEPAPAREPAERESEREMVHLALGHVSRELHRMDAEMRLADSARDLCSRHHLRKIWINKWKWRCRQ